MDLGLRGRKAVVTGGTRGIGRAIAETLAAEGCSVGLCARNAEQVEEAVAAIRTTGATATGASVDVADGAALKTWIDSVAAEFGGLDILVANVSALSAAGAMTEEAWRAALEIDILGTIRSIDAALPHIEKSDAGAIVAISSVSALQYFSGPRAYNSMKAALINHMSNMAHALAPQNIRVNTVSPGTIYFKGGVWHQREQQMPEVYKGALAANPMGRMGRPQEVANATAFLASPAASFITGANMIVDGGMTQYVQY